MSHSAYVQNDNDVVACTSKQKTLSGDLENDPLAQDILAKIEKTREHYNSLETDS